MRTIKAYITFENEYNKATGEIVGNLSLDRIKDIGVEKVVDDFLAELRKQMLKNFDESFLERKPIKI